MFDVDPECTKQLLSVAICIRLRALFPCSGVNGFKVVSDPRPLKILQLVSGRDVNGALMHCKLLSRELASRGHSVTIGCRPGSWIWEQMDEYPIRLVTCPMRRWPPRALFRFANWIRLERFDVIHTHMSSAHMFGIIMKRLTGVPVVATAHSRHIQPHWHLNDMVIANSEATRRYYRRFNLISPHRIETVHCFIDANKFSSAGPEVYRAIRRQWRFRPDSRVIVIAGDVVPHKGHRYLFHSLPELVKRFDDLRVVVVGRFNRNESCAKRLRRYQLTSDLAKRVKWIGRRDNMQEMLGAGDVVVIPSTVESMGLIALESMAVGTPVIAARTGGLKELVRHECNGLLVSRRNSRQITESVTRLLVDENLRKRLVNCGMRWIQEKFSPDCLTDKIENVYSKAIQNTPRRRNGRITVESDDWIYTQQNRAA